MFDKNRFSFILKICLCAALFFYRIHHHSREEEKNISPKNKCFID